MAQQGEGREKVGGCGGREVDCGTGPSCSQKTRGHPTVRQRNRKRNAAASVTTALDRWQAAETSRRRAVEASKKSAEALHNLLKSFEDFDKQVHRITMRGRQHGVGSGWVIFEPNELG